MNNIALKVENLSFSYNSKKIINNVSFELKAKEILTILGPNGVGKTTLLKIIMKTITNYSGKILLFDKDIKNYNTNEFSKNIAIVSSNSSRYQNLRVSDYLVSGYANQLGLLKAPTKEMMDEAYETLKQFHKQYLFNKSIQNLSSGEFQIVLIVRAILQKPKIIVFDEPTSNLDVFNQITILENIKKLHKNGYTIINTTHNPRHSVELEGKTLVMSTSGYYYDGYDKAITQAVLQKAYGLNVNISNTEYRNDFVMNFSKSNEETNLYF